MGHGPPSQGDGARRLASARGGGAAAPGMAVAAGRSVRWRKWNLLLPYLAACSGSVADADGRILDEPVDVDVGAECVPLQEDNPDFAGFTTSEISLEWGHPACGEGACLVNRFQGRVSCPEGQAKPTANDGACFVGSGRQVTRAVCAQCPERPPATTVHCSCRCAPLAGEEPDPLERYCSCASGFRCEQLVSLGRDAGGYCVADVPDLETTDCGSLTGYWAPQCAGVPAAP
jgi:hypothetical protein